MDRELRRRQHRIVFSRTRGRGAHPGRTRGSVRFWWCERRGRRGRSCCAEEKALGEALKPRGFGKKFSARAAHFHSASRTVVPVAFCTSTTSRSLEISLSRRFSFFVELAARPGQHPNSWETLENERSIESSHSDVFRASHRTSPGRESQKTVVYFVRLLYIKEALLFFLAR